MTPRLWRWWLCQSPNNRWLPYVTPRLDNAGSLSVSKTLAINNWIEDFYVERTNVRFGKTLPRRQSLSSWTLTVTWSDEVNPVRKAWRRLRSPLFNWLESGCRWFRVAFCGLGPWLKSCNLHHNRSCLGLTGQSNLPLSCLREICWVFTKSDRLISPSLTSVFFSF